MICSYTFKSENLLKLSFFFSCIIDFYLLIVICYFKKLFYVLEMLNVKIKEIVIQGYLKDIYSANLEIMSLLLQLVLQVKIQILAHQMKQLLSILLIRPELFLQVLVHCQGTGVGPPGEDRKDVANLVPRNPVPKELKKGKFSYF